MTAVATYHLTCDDITADSDDVTAAPALSTLSKQEFTSLLKNQTVLERLLQNNLLHMNWVPVVPLTEDDIEFAVRKKTAVLVRGTKENPSSFSILTHPYKVFIFTWVK